MDVSTGRIGVWAGGTGLGTTFYMVECYVVVLDCLTCVVVSCCGWWWMFVVVLLLVVGEGVG